MRGWQMKDGMAPQVSNPKSRLTSWILMTMAQNHGTGGNANSMILTLPETKTGAENGWLED